MLNARALLTGLPSSFFSRGTLLHCCNCRLSLRADTNVRASDLGFLVARQGLSAGEQQLLTRQQPVHAIGSRPEWREAFQCNPADCRDCTSSCLYYQPKARHAKSEQCSCAALGDLTDVSSAMRTYKEQDGGDATADLRAWRCVKPSSSISWWYGQFVIGMGSLAFPLCLSKPCRARASSKPSMLKKAHGILTSTSATVVMFTVHCRALTDGRLQQAD